MAKDQAPALSTEAKLWLERLGVAQAKGLCAQALTHASMGSPNYERLEYLGDAVLKLESSRWLYAQAPAMDEGTMTKARAWLISDATLAQVSQHLGLPAHLKVKNKELRQKISVQASALEALLGALLLLHGPEACGAATEAWLGPWLRRCVQAAAEANPKEELQEWCQALGQALPQYAAQALKSGGFEVAVSLNGHKMGQGQGPSKRAAEQAAARQALLQMNAKQPSQGGPD